MELSHQGSEQSELSCLVAGMVRVNDSEQTGGVRLAEGGGVQGRGRLPLTPGSLVARGAVARHLPQPGDEGALAIVEAVTSDGAAGALRWLFRKQDPSHGSPHPRHRVSSRWWCRSCRGRGGGGGGRCDALLNLVFDVLVVPPPPSGVESHTGVLAPVR